MIFLLSLDCFLRLLVQQPLPEEVAFYYLLIASLRILRQRDSVQASYLSTIS